MAGKSGDKDIWQLHISLKHSDPPIWRRVLVPVNITLEDLHLVIQHCFDWDGEHLHGFRAKSVLSLGPRNVRTSTWVELPAEGYEDEVTLAELGFSIGSKFQYIYDFGDSWTHDLKLEKVLDRDPEMSYPVCVKAARAAPIEDCGGLWGYYDMLEAIADPEHPEHEDYLEWWGDNAVDPDAVDLDAINERLSRMKL